jgi:hypothetical protein
MGAVGLEPTQTEVERFTVFHTTTSYNTPQIITTTPLKVYMNLFFVDICRFQCFVVGKWGKSGEYPSKHSFDRFDF